MLDPIHEECGIAAVYRLDPTANVDALRAAGAAGERARNGGNGATDAAVENVVSLLPDMLIDLQNRGQLAAGISRFNESDARLLDTYKDVGSVSDVFHLTLPDASKFREIIDKYAGRAAIGHVRYATCGKDDPSYAQPFHRKHGRPWKTFAFCFNGNIANYREVRANILEKGYHLVVESDTELLMHHLAYALQSDFKPDFVSVFRQLAEAVDGAYSMAFLNGEGDMILARDPFGFRPLCYGLKGKLFAAASESLALANRGFREIREVEPGELIHVRPEGISKHRFAKSTRRAWCFFEHVYFANVASNLNGSSVYQARTRLGEALAAAETESIDDDCIAVPVPDTAKAACDAMAYKLGIPSREGLIRNRYVGRTFIEGQNRQERVRRKYTALPEVLRDKRVFLVEDSIVRSTTLRAIVSMLRDQGGAREVHVRVACPPIMTPCGYGIDMSTVSELFAPRHLSEPQVGEYPEHELARATEDLGTDSLRYLTVEALTTALGKPQNELCVGCLIGQYPTPWGQRLYREALRHRDRPVSARTYERLDA